MGRSRSSSSSGRPSGSPFGGADGGAGRPARAVRTRASRTKVSRKDNHQGALSQGSFFLKFLVKLFSLPILSVVSVFRAVWLVLKGALAFIFKPIPLLPEKSTNGSLKNSDAGRGNSRRGMNARQAVDSVLNSGENVDLAGDYKSDRKSSNEPREGGGKRASGGETSKADYSFLLTIIVMGVFIVSLGYLGKKVPALQTLFRSGVERVVDMLSWQITHIRIEGTSYIDKYELVPLLYDSAEDGQMSVTKPLPEIKRILENHPLVKEVGITRRLPHQLVVIIQEHEILMRHYNPRTSHHSIITSDFELLDYTSSSSKRVKYITVVGKFSTEGLRSLYQLVKQYPDIYGSTTVLEPFIHQSWNLILNNKTRVMLPNENTEDALKVLRYLIKSKGLLRLPIEQVDLRVPSKVFLKPFAKGEERSFSYVSQKVVKVDLESILSYTKDVESENSGLKSSEARRQMDSHIQQYASQRPGGSDVLDLAGEHDADLSNGGLSGNGVVDKKENADKDNTDKIGNKNLNIDEIIENTNISATHIATATRNYLGGSGSESGALLDKISANRTPTKKSNGSSGGSSGGSMAREVGQEPPESYNSADYGPKAQSVQGPSRRGARDSDRRVDSRGSKRIYIGGESMKGEGRRRSVSVKLMDEPQPESSQKVGTASGAIKVSVLDATGIRGDSQRVLIGGGSGNPSPLESLGIKVPHSEFVSRQESLIKKVR